MWRLSGNLCSMRDSLQSSPLFGARRLVIGLVISVFILLTDVLFIQFLDITTSTEALTQLTINTLGYYGGLTIAALLDTPESGTYY
jgi:hypothetical protein